MVRIFKVKELEIRRRSLLARSEVYRQTLRLEVRNIQFSAELQKRRLHVVQKIFRIGSMVAPLVTMFLFKKRNKTEANSAGAPNGGFLSKLSSGLKFAGQMKRFL
jgi:hypothetical protein